MLNLDFCGIARLPGAVRGLPAVVCLLALLSASCGEEAEPVSAAVEPTLTYDAGGGGDCTAGQSRSCTCPNEPTKMGSQTCYNGYWLNCDCYAAPPPGVVVQGECWPGRYVGNFIGLYYSGFAFAGIPIPVTGVDLSGAPPLVLQLEENTASGGSVEFPTYSVSEGYIKGTADGIFPFEAKLTGSLDCATKKFVGEMDGWYSLLLESGIDLNKGYFKGPITGTYDGATHSFTFGKWDVLEFKNGNPVPGYGLVLTKLGGNGTWDAKHESTVPASMKPSAADAGAADAGP